MMTHFNAICRVSMLTHVNGMCRVSGTESCMRENGSDWSSLGQDLLSQHQNGDLANIYFKSTKSAYDKISHFLARTHSQSNSVRVQRKSLCVHFDVRKSASNVILYMKDLQMCAYCPDSRHVAYFIIHCQ